MTRINTNIKEVVVFKYDKQVKQINLFSDLA